jgi:hypothetical protein
MACPDSLSAHCNHQTLDEILELTNVPWPAVLLKDLKRVGCKMLCRQAICAAMELEEVLTQQRDIACPLPQRG